MELLIDTHVLLWLETDPKALGDRLALFEDPANAIYVSAASVWEIAVKRAKGKLAFAGFVCDAVERRGFIHLPISAQHAEVAGMLPQHHADPIDRLMVAQALLEHLTLATRDSMITKYTVPILRV